jgi:hypothetical protein
LASRLRRYPWRHLRVDSLGVFRVFESFSIFQSKDDPETELCFQSSVILKTVIEEAAKRPISFLGSWF